MTDSRPVICTSLHLPPDTQALLRIRDIALLIFLPNVDRLRLAMEATEDIYSEVAQNVYKTLHVLRDELQKVFGPQLMAQELAGKYHTLLKALEEKKSTQSFLYEVNIGAHGCVKLSKEGQQALSVFRRELEKAVERVTTTTGVKDKKGSKYSLNSAKNIQSVSEILTAINECNGLLQQCHDQFALLATQTQNFCSIDSDLPSEEELQVMRAKWETYLDTVKDVWRQGYEIANEFIMPTRCPYGPTNTSGRCKPRLNVSLWCRALFQRLDKRDLVLSGNDLLIRGRIGAVVKRITALRKQGSEGSRGSPRR